MASPEVRKTAKPKQPDHANRREEGPSASHQTGQESRRGEKTPRPMAARPRPAKAKFVKKPTAKRSTASKR